MLVVDDDPEIRSVLETVLGMEGYGVATAENGREAFARLRGARGTCVILLDLMMPVMNGWQFRDAQRGDPSLAEIPVVVISAAGNLRERAAQLDAAGYLEKPLDFDDLLRAVGRHCG